jgi:Cof subfamily protein (haloacid dehalogenase superfamily)
MARPPIEALAVDVDGTLLDPQHRIRPAVREAVAELTAAGVTVIVASARYPGALRAIQDSIGVAGRPLVACQGSVAGWFSAGGFERLYELPIHPDLTRAVLDLAASLALPVSRFGADAWHVARGDTMAGQEAAIVGCEPSVVSDLRSVDEPAGKLTVMAPAGREGDLAILARRLPRGVRGSISRPDYLEIVDVRVSKAIALEVVLRHLGLAPSQLAAAGDGANDEEMLRMAAVGIAMGHAPASLRALATWTVPSNEDDGLAVGIRRLMADGLVAGG